MIQIFLGQEKKVNRSGYVYKYLYFYNTITSEIFIFNPWTHELKRTDNGSIVELNYKDEFRERINKHLISWQE